MAKTLGVTGNRPFKFPWNYFSLRRHAYLDDMRGIVERYIEDGFDTFLAGGAMGVDQDFALTVIDLKQKYPHIQLELALPHPSYAEKFDSYFKARDREIYAYADAITMVCEHYSRDSMQLRNRFIVDHSDSLLAFWNLEEKGGTFNTIKYAKSKKVPVEIYDLNLLS